MPGISTATAAAAIAITATPTLTRIPFLLRHDGAPLSVVAREAASSIGVRWLIVASFIGAAWPPASNVGPETGVWPAGLRLPAGVPPGEGPENAGSPISGPRRASLSRRSA